MKRGWCCTLETKEQHVHRLRSHMFTDQKVFQSTWRTESRERGVARETERISAQKGFESSTKKCEFYYLGFSYLLEDINMTVI